MHFSQTTPIAMSLHLGRCTSVQRVVPLTPPFVHRTNLCQAKSSCEGISGEDEGELSLPDCRAWIRARLSARRACISTAVVSEAAIHVLHKPSSLLAYWPPPMNDDTQQGQDLKVEQAVTSVVCRRS